jgi:hypothetical protein
MGHPAGSHIAALLTLDASYPKVNTPWKLLITFIYILDAWRVKPHPNYDRLTAPHARP